jgi:hypothetical protein
MVRIRRSDANPIKYNEKVTLAIITGLDNNIVYLQIIVDQKVYF